MKKTFDNYLEAIKLTELDKSIYEWLLETERKLKAYGTPDKELSMALKSNNKIPTSLIKKYRHNRFALDAAKHLGLNPDKLNG